MICRPSIFVLVSCLVFLACSQESPSAPVRRSSLNEDWTFTLDGQSSRVDLPHDWSITRGFQQKEGTPTGFLPGGIGEYLKTFSYEMRPGHRALLTFDGVYMNASVRVNGIQICEHPYGYTSFRCDITDYLHDGKNVLEVTVRNEGKNSRWYSGSGIYRHVWLDVYPETHLDEWDLSIREDGIRAVVHNESSFSFSGILQADVLDCEGRKVFSLHQRVSIPERGADTVFLPFPEGKRLSHWSPDEPVLYTANVSLLNQGKHLDRLSMRFGVRDIRFTPQEGMTLNGKPILLRGGCIHHDNGFLGSAAYDEAEIRKVELMKAHGFNAVRCAHNPPSPRFLSACDSLGLLVIDESFDQWLRPKNPDDYHLYFNEWYREDIASMVRRDRNHPSVFLWSIGNEIADRADPEGVSIADSLREEILSMDPTRGITAAINDFWDNPDKTWEKDSDRAFASLDVGGYNYLWWEYERDLGRNPERILYSSESTAQERAVNWKYVETSPNIFGDFIWTAIDYLGEASIGHQEYLPAGENTRQILDWPWFNAWCGDIDLCGDPKPQSTLRDVVWDRTPVSMLVHAPQPEGLVESVSYWGWPDETASWNWGGHEGLPMTVRVFCKSGRVRLLLNGETVGEQDCSLEALFQVPYVPGELTAIALDSGTPVGLCTLRTAGKPVAIRLTLENPETFSQGRLAYVKIELIDQLGQVVPDADQRVFISLQGGNAKLAGAGNACPTDMDSFRSNTPKTFRGRALAIIDASDKQTAVQLRVTSGSLPETTILLRNEKQ